MQAGSQGDGVESREELLLHLARARSLVAEVEASIFAGETLAALDRIAEIIVVDPAPALGWRAVVHPLPSEEVKRGARAASFFAEAPVSVLAAQDMVAFERRPDRERRGAGAEPGRGALGPDRAAARGLLARALELGGRNPALLTALAFTFALGFALSLVLTRR